MRNYKCIAIIYIDRKVQGDKKMKKQNFKWLLVVAWMAIIFIFSNDPASVSDAKSGFVIDLFNAFGVDLSSRFGELANFIVRKAAHFTEYFILFMLLYNALAENNSWKKAVFISLIAVFLYSCSDEFHQTFIKGREGRFRDVLIDTTGGAFGALLVKIWVALRKIFYNKKSC